jgi:hypothetical protein
LKRRQSLTGPVQFYMHLILTILLTCLTVSTVCFGQSKKRSKEKQIKTDTVDIFQRLDNIQFKEKNIFWTDKNELGLIQTHRYVTKVYDASYEIQLTAIFYNWDSVGINSGNDVKYLKAECKKKGTFSSETYSPVGTIRLVQKTQDRVTFHFDIQALSNDRTQLLIYKGERTFRPEFQVKDSPSDK